MADEKVKENEEAAESFNEESSLDAKLIEKISKDIKSTEIPSFSKIIEYFKENDIVIPQSYDSEGLDGAIKILAQIQALRDYLVFQSILFGSKKRRIEGLWKRLRNHIIFNDPEAKKLRSQETRESYSENLFPEEVAILDKVTGYEENVKTLLENMIAKYYTCSKQIAVLEMQISLGEVENKRKRSKSDD